MDCKEVIIYTLAHPITDEVRYIGKTYQSLTKRLADHHFCKHNKHKTNWLKGLKQKGLTAKIEVLEIVYSDNWVDEERFYITYFRFLGFRLLNICDGGEGITFTQEIKDKISKSNTGKIRSRETKERLSRLNKIGANGTKGRPHSEEHKRYLSIKLKGHAVSESTKPLISASLFHKRKAIIQLDMDGNILKEWPSITQASEITQVSKGHIIKCCKEKKDGEGYIAKSAGGFKWKYKI
jgi:group I intron endonuclease